MIAQSVERARTAWDRAVGLVGRATLQAEGGLWLEPCSAVHTVGMRFPIDVVLLNAEYTVLAVASRVAPMRLLVTSPGTAAVVELPAGTAARAGIGVGTGLRLGTRHEDSTHP